MGETFAGRYELVDLLGQGGMGSVWRVWDHVQPRYLAAKVLRQSDAASLLRFVREQSFRIEHPHVVRPLGWVGEDDRVLYTMPIVRGGSLATLLSGFGALPPSWVVVLLDQLLDALSAVHAAGIVHRDVKPGNLLLEPTERCRPHLRLSDFGIATPLDEPQPDRPSAVLCTPGYCPPERLRGAAPHPREDLYSAGMVAVELLTGSRPGPVRSDRSPVAAGAGSVDTDRTEDEEAATAAAAGVAAMQRPDRVPPGLWDFILRLTAVDPADRPAAADEARTRLAAVLLTTGPMRLEDQADGRCPGGVKVADQVPELPAGWGPAGPGGAAAVRVAAADPPAPLALAAADPPAPAAAAGPPAPVSAADQAAAAGPPASAAAARPVPAADRQVRERSRLLIASMLTALISTVFLLATAVAIALT